MNSVTVEEISRYAAGGSAPLEAMTCPERCLFYTLKDLYALHRENRLTKAEGEKRKQEALTQYRKDCDDYAEIKKILRYHSALWKGIELAATKYSKEPSIENADAFMEAVYGVKRKQTPEEAGQ